MANWRALLLFLAIFIAGNTHAEETLTPQENTTKNSASPTITAVKPNPVPGAQQRQWIKLIGEGFNAKSKVMLRLRERIFPIPPERTRFISSKILEIYVNVSTGPATWQAQVSNSEGQKTKPFSFEVKPPAAIASQPQEVEERGRKAEVEALEKKAEETDKKIEQVKETAEAAKLEAAQTALKKATVQQQVEKTAQAARAAQQQLEAAKAKAQATGDAADQKEVEKLAEEAEKRKQATAAEESRLAAIEAKEQAAKEKTTATETEIEKLQQEFAELRKQRAAKRTFLEQATTAAWIILAGFIIWFIKRLAVNKFESVTVKREEVREGSARLRTLVLLLNWLGTILIVLTVSYLVLDEFGINMAPILASVGIVGLALGFGGQYLIRDIINGIFILIEGQYSINDIIQIDEFSGVVEVVNLRHTQLRDLDGRAIYIPNGEIKKVVNFTKGYGQMVLDIGVAYKENVDHVMEVMKKVVEEMRQIPMCARFIKDFEMFGVEKFGESEIIIRCRFKTRAGKQWEIAREYRRRLKNRFDELGIEIPFPQRTLNWKTPSQSRQTEETEHTKSATYN
ncbi:mechanosensitive ion channel family protein [Nitrosococcus oceani]|uniref:MscS Mechanosensitive ion channel n=2 Tax=Nitrosococcus oceani TaxID=1229 RepID=Q3JDH5_NITOC|nr:mechanosensitive ion channel family protein [Nitrosococcus oceani]KFI20382.1 mechanosensitive ion channel protein MscS [Nitrosococcus oceani C-27]ABA57121.1 MscS Mechanosensitive ion channel [Nitrosococcus oceani ATCC 19707]EDZ65671.1 transporter, MscS family [Nitrosococcus oceani AFC27]KFI23532.1 mechanosensitive ion channel protein MscS [Nitrosococcus oceani]GEM19859.1 mechanosensitive ion channel protein MscS [Nitrosococcus oceani]